MKRELSWILAGLAYVAPPAWAYLEQASVYESVQAQHGYICGLPMLAIVFIASVASGALSFVSFSLGYASFHYLAKPRSVLRKVELVVLAVPFVCSVGILSTLLAD
ncbi:hypothetical protein [Dokdonella sp.]|uniref:hypothetical protein n=1 Tax=Dokdonella sp. TaxID=2291710 RepID=UPI0035270036